MNISSHFPYRLMIGLLVSLGCLSSKHLIAQGVTIEPNVLASSGNLVSAPANNFTVDWTLGELAVTSLTPENGIGITQGFHQVFDYDFTVSTATPLIEEGIFSIYPNPAQDDLFIQASELYSGELQVSLFDLNGKLIQSHLKWVESSEIISLKLEDLSSGVYLLRLISPDVLINPQNFRLVITN